MVTSDASPASILAAAQQAQRWLNGVIVPTPLLPLGSLDAMLPSAFPTQTAIWLKPENLQRTGSFKLRGAYTKVRSLAPTQRARGVITYSSGNHGQGVAYAARLLQTRAVIVMPTDAIATKVAGAQALGADVRFCGVDSTQRQLEAERLACDEGLALVRPYDDPMIVAGQGTIGLEIVQALGIDVPLLAVVPVGGGGLISGVAQAIKQTHPRALILGIEPETAADGQASLRAGAIVDGPPTHTVADGLRARHLGDLNFALIRQFVEAIETVSDRQILDAVVHLHRRGLVVEPSGAVTTAALLAGRVSDWVERARLLGSDGSVNVVLVQSGGNIDPQMLSCLLTGCPQPRRALCAVQGCPIAPFAQR